MPASQTDTIIAQATPPGRSGIAIIRVSGPRALELVRALSLDRDLVFQHGRILLKSLYEPNSEQLIDRALVTYFQAPHSFTGEDVVEINCHGSPVLINSLLESLLFLGARIAEPGEFTLRALGNNRLDLSQAEAIRDLIDARTEAAAKQALRQLGGDLSTRLQPIKDLLVETIVPLESSLEFVEDDLPEFVLSKVRTDLQALSSKLGAMAASFRSGRLLKDGLKVALVGRPNVGKSSVFNGLLSQERAIVTSIPGTTRDTLSEFVNLDGVPVLLTDTAGVHQSNDVVEQLGIERTLRSIKEADLAVIVLDGTSPLLAEDLEVLQATEQTKSIIVINKSDLPEFGDPLTSTQIDQPVIELSALSGHGLSELRDAIIRPFKSSESFESDFLITNARHHDLLRRAIDALSQSLSAIDDDQSEEIILIGLYEALRFLGEITGETTSEDILTQIFSTFCIGK